MKKITNFYQTKDSKMQRELTKLEKLLADKENQINKLHRDNQLQMIIHEELMTEYREKMTQVIDNQKLKEKELLKENEELQQQL